jgi:hypothetical protein
VQLAQRPLPISAADLKGGSRLPHSTENLGLDYTCTGPLFVNVSRPKIWLVLSRTKDELQMAPAYDKKAQTKM